MIKINKGGVPCGLRRNKSVAGFINRFTVLDPGGSGFSEHVKGENQGCLCHKLSSAGIQGASWIEGRT